MYKIGLSTPGFVNEELFKSCRDSGVSHLEISVSKELSERLCFDELKKWSEQYGITLWSFHLPFYPFSEIDISNPSICEQSYEYLCTYIDKGTKIGIDKYIIHASGEPIDEADRRTRMECAKKYLSRLADYAEERGAVICVENLPRTCLGRDSSDILELLDSDKRLLACFDTNHLLAEDAIKFIRAVGKKILTLHVSDYDFIDERHWLPGEGLIDWQSILGALKEIGYSGPWLYEIDFNPPWTISRDRDLCCEDFAKNASELFSGAPLTVIGKPKAI